MLARLCRGATFVGLVDLLARPAQSGVTHLSDRNGVEVGRQRARLCVLIDAW